MSVQGKCRSEHSNNRKVDHKLVKSIIQTHSVFYGMVISKKVLSQSRHRIETRLGVFVEVLEVQSSISFEFCLDEDFIEFW